MWVWKKCNMQGTCTDNMSRKHTHKTDFQHHFGMWVDFIMDPCLNSVTCKYNTTGPAPNTITDITKMKSQGAGECREAQVGAFIYVLKSH